MSNDDITATKYKKLTIILQDDDFVITRTFHKAKNLEFTAVDDHDLKTYIGARVEINFDADFDHNLGEVFKDQKVSLRAMKGSYCEYQTNIDRSYSGSTY